MSDNFAELGARIRELREICGYTPESLVAELSIDLETLNRYETKGEDIPISVIYRLANIFKVDMNELLTGNSPHLDKLCVTRRGQGHPINRYPGYNFQELSAAYKHKIMEPLLVTVMPDEKKPGLVTHPGQEFNLVLEGVIELFFDEKSVLLNAGDAVYFDPAHPHGQRAVGVKSRFLTVITE